MNGKQLKNSILQWAIQGKLVPQDPNDEPASVLLERIREEKARLVKEKKIKKDKNESIIFRGDDNSHYEKFADGTVKCIDDEIPFEIPQSWCWVRLAQVLTVKGGKRIPLGDSFAPGPTSHIYIRVTEMKNHTLVANNLKYISDSVYEKIKNYTIGKGDLYLTIAGTIGSVGIVPEMFDGMNLTENAVKLTNILIDKMFLVYGISSQFVQSQFSEKTKQMAQPKLAIERILTTLIPLPPINEQISIVSRIEEIMPIADKYEKSQEALDKLNADIFDKLKKSVLQEAIQGKLVAQNPTDEPASELLKRINEEKEQLIKAGKILVTFIFVTIGWVFFRADSFQNAFLILKKMVMEFSLSIGAIEQTILVFTGDMMSLCYFLVSLVMIGILMVREFRYTYGDLKKENLKKCEKEELIWIAFCVFAIICFGDFGTKGFIYANF